MSLKVALPSGRTLKVKANFPYPTSPVGYRVLLKGRTGIVVGLSEEGEVLDVSFPDEKPFTTEKHILSVLEVANHYAQLPWLILFDLVPSVFDWREEEYICLGEKDWKYVDRLSLNVLEYVKVRRAVKEESLKEKFGKELVEKLLDLGFLKRVKEWKMPNLTTTYYSLLVPLEEAIQKLKRFKNKEGKQRLIYYLLENRVVSKEELRSAGFKSEDIRALVQKGIVGEREEIIQEIREVPTLRQIKMEYLKPLGERSVIFGSWEGIIGHISSELERLVQERKNAFIFCPSLSLLSVLYQHLYPLLKDRLILLKSQDKPKDFIKKWFSVSSEEGIVLLGTKIALLAPLKTLSLLVYFDEGFTKAWWNGFDTRLFLYTLSRYYGANFLFVSTHIPLALCLRDDWEKHYHTPQADVFIFRRKAQEILSPQAKELIKNSQEEWLFLVNKGGYAYAFCNYCGWIVECPKCKSFLTLSKSKDTVFCTSCGYKAPAHCPECGRQLDELGFGIEKAMEEVFKLFGQRENFHFDTVPRLGRVYDNVLVLHGDNILSVPWFDSLERYFSYMWQALCISKKRLIIQTVLEDHPILGYIKGKDWKGFCNEELERRKVEDLPPFKRLVKVKLKAFPKLRNLPIEVKRRKVEGLWELLIKVDKRSFSSLMRNLREYKPVELEVY